MSRIKNVGGGFIDLDGGLLNLKAFKEIKKEYLVDIPEHIDPLSPEDFRKEKVPLGA